MEEDVYLRSAERVFSTTTMEMHYTYVRCKGVLFQEIGYDLTKGSQLIVKIINHLGQTVLIWVNAGVISDIQNVERIPLVNKSSDSDMIE